MYRHLAAPNCEVLRQHRAGSARQQPGIRAHREHFEDHCVGHERRPGECRPTRRSGSCQTCDVVHTIRSSSAYLRLVPMPVKGEAGTRTAAMAHGEWFDDAAGFDLPSTG